MRLATVAVGSRSLAFGLRSCNVVAERREPKPDGAQPATTNYAIANS
jgi:hypothetical protein